MTAARSPDRADAPVPSASAPPPSVTAVVLTHMRPGLAGDVTRSLIEVEGFAPERVVVVVNGVGGLDDPALEAKVRMVRLPTNTGPAGGFRAGLLAATSETATEWIYLCEDDVGLFSLPRPRVGALVDRLEDRTDNGRPVGAVVAYGRVFVGRGTHTLNVVPPAGRPAGLQRVDVACWGATLVSRSVVDAGVLPDPEWFFGLEDFDFFCRTREAGFDVLLDERGGTTRRGRADRRGQGGRAPRPAADRRLRGVAALLPRPELARPGAPARPAELVRLAAGLCGPPAPGRARPRGAVGHRARALGRRPRADGREPPLPAIGRRALRRAAPARPFPTPGRRNWARGRGRGRGGVRRAT